MASSVAAPPAVLWMTSWPVDASKRTDGALAARLAIGMPFSPEADPVQAAELAEDVSPAAALLPARGPASDGRTVRAVCVKLAEPRCVPGLQPGARESGSRTTAEQLACNSKSAPSISMLSSIRGWRGVGGKKTMTLFR